MIGEYISKKYNGIKPNIKACFFSAMLCGLMAHIYALANHLYNYDELNCTPTGFGTGITMGRWGLSVLASLTEFLFNYTYTLPVFNGLITILMYTLVACITVRLFEIEDSFYSAAIGAIFTTFPAVVCRMFFMFTTHFYAIAECIVAIGVFVLFKSKNRVIKVLVSTVLLVFGTAVYQATFVTGVCLVVGVLLVRFIKDEIEEKSMIKEIALCVCYLGVSMVLYLLSNKVALKINGFEMIKHSENYDTMGQLSFKQLIEGVAYCYKCFIRIPLKDVYSVNPNIIVKVAFGVSIIIMAYAFIKIITSKKRIFQKAIFALITFVLPIAVNLIYIMSISSGIMYTIMVFDIVYVFAFAIAEIEAIGTLENDNNISSQIKKIISRIHKPLNTIFAMFLIGTIITYIWFANGNYISEEYTNKHDEAYYQTLLTQIKSVDGYEDTMPIVILGSPQHDATDILRHMIEDTFNIGGKSATNVSAYSTWAIMTRVLGYMPTLKGTEADMEYFSSKDEVRKMPCYPADGAIRVIEDTIVIKFEE